MMRWPCALMAFLATSNSFAQQDSALMCTAAHEAAQLHRKADALFEARRELQSCSRSECPELVRADCAKWLKEVDAELPALTIDARTSRGARIHDVRVLLDGEVVAERSSGEPLIVPVGEHVVRVEHAGAPPIERRMTFERRRKDARMRVTFDVAAPRVPKQRAPRPDPEPRAPDGEGPTPAAWIVGGVGIVGLGLFAGFGIDGLIRRNELDDIACKPSCPAEDVATIRRDFLVADVALGIGAASMAAAVILLAVTWE